MDSSSSGRTLTIRADGYRIERYYPNGLNTFLGKQIYPPMSWQEIEKVKALDEPRAFVPGAPPGRYRIGAFGPLGWSPWVEIEVA